MEEFDFMEEIIWIVLDFENFQETFTEMMK